MSERFESNLPSQENERGYPEDFKARVKEMFPDWKEMHKALEDGSESGLVGYYLNKFRGLLMEPKEIVDAFENGNQGEVLKAARRAIKIDELYNEWLKYRQK